MFLGRLNPANFPRLSTTQSNDSPHLNSLKLVSKQTSEPELNSKPWTILT